MVTPASVYAEPSFIYTVASPFKVINGGIVSVISPFLAYPY
jgi:hypothetical protein